MWQQWLCVCKRRKNRVEGALFGIQLRYRATTKRDILQKQNEEVRELSDRGYKWELYQKEGYKGSGGIMQRDAMNYTEASS